MLKTTLKLTLIIGLFCTSAFADGEMGTGAKAGSSTGGGLVCAECVFVQNDTKDNSAESFMEYIRDFFTKIIG